MKKVITFIMEGELDEKELDHAIERFENDIFASGAKEVVVCERDRQSLYFNLNNGSEIVVEEDLENNEVCICLESKYDVQDLVRISPKDEISIKVYADSSDEDFTHEHIVKNITI